MTDLTDNTVAFFFKLCLYVADPTTFLASDSVLGSLFSSESSLFIQLWKRNIFLSLYLINIVNIKILLRNYIMLLYILM